MWIDERSQNNCNIPTDVGSYKSVLVQFTFFHKWSETSISNYIGYQGADVETTVSKIEWYIFENSTNNCTHPFWI